MFAKKPPKTRPAAKSPSPAVADRNSKDVRSARAKTKAGHLPTELDNPFFASLLERWPESPTLSHPVSQMCTTNQINEADYRRIAKMLKLQPKMHRKQWEFIYIYRTIEAAGLVGEGHKGLVFGVGREKLPALLIANGCQVTATDLPMEQADGHWAGGGQHADSIEKIMHPQLVDRELFLKNATFRPVNMNAIPDDLRGYDFCWSACALEHLGSLLHGLDFIRYSLDCLQPGGLAVHTTEFNLGSATETLESGPSVVYRESDLLAFVDELGAQGHQITLNLNPGAEATDRLIDRDRDSDIHLRLYARHQIASTSFGIAVRKSAS